MPWYDKFAVLNVGSLEKFNNDNDNGECSFQGPGVSTLPFVAPGASNKYISSRYSRCERLSYFAFASTNSVGAVGVGIGPGGMFRKRLLSTPHQLSPILAIGSVILS